MGGLSSAHAFAQEKIIAGFKPLNAGKGLQVDDRRHGRRMKDRKQALLVVDSNRQIEERH
jgi:hypothetical protein